VTRVQAKAAEVAFDGSDRDSAPLAGLTHGLRGESPVPVVDEVPVRCADQPSSCRNTYGRMPPLR